MGLEDRHGGERAGLQSEHAVPGRREPPASLGPRGIRPSDASTADIDRDHALVPAFVESRPHTATLGDRGVKGWSSDANGSVHISAPSPARRAERSVPSTAYTTPFRTVGAVQPVPP
ncbi:hypothetical protein SVIO_077320 [Streptomyces violaceusniger]|uniref:Uncharacterized protein n=1 Tax=Streptomyces violaceusniger TaxID=68280 RepID=A0A4D4LGT3_STRVO|nr:hypothetical protein SVIO_077320 [Streptomyces violaceusniger]